MTSNIKMSSLHHLSFYYTFYSPTNLLWRLRLLLIWYNLCHAWNGIKIWSWNINFTKLHKAFRKWIIHFLDICHNCMCVLMCLNINIPIQLFQKLLTTVYIRVEGNLKMWTTSTLLFQVIYHSATRLLLKT